MTKIPLLLDAESVRTVQVLPSGAYELVLKGADGLGPETDERVLLCPSVLRLLRSADSVADELKIRALFDDEESGIEPPGAARVGLERP
jgi:hypothetical protein